MSAAAALHPRAAAELDRLRASWPAEFRDSARCAFLGQQPGARDAAGYPSGFHSWPLDRRNAWWAGFNRGRCDRQTAKQGAPGGRL